MKQDFEDIELSMEEEFSCILEAKKSKHYDLVKNRFAQLAKEGKSALDFQPDRDLPIDLVDVNDGEIKPYFDAMKREKFSKIQLQETLKVYCDKIKTPKSHPLPMKIIATML